MHIGFITPEFPHEDFVGSVGGIGTFVKNLSISLIDEGNEVSIFIFNQSQKKIYKKDRLTIHHVSFLRFPGFTGWFGRKHFNRYLNQKIKEDKIDLVEAPDWAGYTAFMKFACPLVIRLHGTDTYFCNLEKRKVKRKNRFLENNALKTADTLVGVSHFVANETKKLFSIKKEIKVIYNGVSVEKFSPNHLKIEKKNILYFGTIIRKKGVISLAKMFSLLVEKEKDVTLTFLGRDTVDFFEETSTLNLCLKEMSEAARARFRYLEAVPYEEVQEKIKCADIVILPSYAEAFPMTWLEAMALEKKMITSNIGWAKELMIDGETGYTINPDDIQDFLQKTHNLLANTDDVIDFGKNARERIKTHFNQQMLVTKNIEMYETLINEH